MLVSQNCPMDKSILSFNCFNMWYILASGGIWLNGTSVVWEEVILVPSNIVNYIY